MLRASAHAPAPPAQPQVGPRQVRISTHHRSQPGPEQLLNDQGGAKTSYPSGARTTSQNHHATCASRSQASRPARRHCCAPTPAALPARSSSSRSCAKVTGSRPRTDRPVTARLHWHPADPDHRAERRTSHGTSLRDRNDLYLDDSQAGHTGAPGSVPVKQKRHGEHDTVTMTIAEGFRSASSNLSIFIESDVWYSSRVTRNTRTG
jgi:hypothetical protein